MKKNLGNIDGLIRVIMAVAFAALYYGQIVTGTLGIILLVLAGVLVVTSLVGFCPLYKLVGFNTCPVKKA